MSHSDIYQQGTWTRPGVQAAVLPAPLALRAGHPGVLLPQAAHRAELLLGAASVLGEVQQASFTPLLGQVILVPLSCTGESVLLQGCFGWSVHGEVVANKVTGKQRRQVPEH